MVVLFFPDTWDSWLYHFSIEVRVRLRLCTPELGLWEELPIRSSLLTCRTSTLCSFFHSYKTLGREFCWENLLISPSRQGCTQAWSDPAAFCFRVRRRIWILCLLHFSEWNQKPDLLLLTILNCWENDNVSRSRLIRWEFPLRNWPLCVSRCHVRNTPRNVDKNASLLSNCDSQHLPQCVPHLFFLIRFAYLVECYYVDVKRKNLETLDNKVYTWSWHQVLGRCAACQYGHSDHFRILWKNWDIGYKTMYQQNISSREAQE